MPKYVKNTTGSDKTWVGQLVEAGTYYLIQSTEEVSWASNSTLLTDIGSGDAVIAKTDDGNNDLGINDGIDYLKNNPGPTDAYGAPIQRARAFASSDDMRFRGTGVSGTMTKTTSTNLDYKMTEDRYINGLEFVAKDHVHGDNAHFQVVDVDNLLGYGAGTVLDQFGTSWYVAEDTARQGPYILPYPALVNNGFYLRIVYNSVGTVNNVDLKVNYFLHKKG